jgi:cytochrome c-type biogenesis protein
MTLSLSLGAFIAGVLMFLAPCTLPIVPGYVAFIAGERRAVLRNALAFVLGFSAVFILLGASVGLFGIIIGPWRYALARLGGALFILFGLTMLRLVRVPVISAERHLALPSFLRVGTVPSSALIGCFFALGWSPCIGPILGTILFVASASATALKGALLLAIFSAGLGLPFLLTAAALERAQPLFARMGAVAEVLSKLGGVFLVLLGILMLFNQTGLLVSWGYAGLDFIHYGRLLNYL